MAVRICPSCGGKVASTRTTCSHCGHEMIATKTCPECEESIDANAHECPVCGFEFNEVPMSKVLEKESTSKIETVENDFSSQEEPTSDKWVCNFRCDITKEQFLRSVFYNLTKHENSPADIMKAKFGEVQEDEIQVFVAMGYGDGHYSASIGYDRVEKYVEQKYGFVGSGQHYTINGHPRIGDGNNVYHDVEKSRTVTDWQAYNGNIVHECCHKILTGFLNTKWESSVQSVFYNKKSRDLTVITPETTTLSDTMYSLGIDELRQKIKDKAYYSLPGDQSKDFICSVSISEYSFAKWILPTYRVYYEYNGEKYCVEGVAIDGIEPILEIPEESATAKSEEKLDEENDAAVKVAKKPFWLVVTMWVTAFLGGFLGITRINLAATIIGFSLMIGSIAGAIVLNKLIKKKVRTIEDDFYNRIEKLKHVKGLLFAKKLSEYGFDGVTNAEKNDLDLYDVNLEEINIDDILTDLENPISLDAYKITIADFTEASKAKTWISEKAKKLKNVIPNKTKDKNDLPDTYKSIISSYESTDVNLEENRSIDDRLIASDNHVAVEGKATITNCKPITGHNKKNSGAIFKISFVLNIIALITLIVGIAFLVFTRFLRVVISNGYGEIYNGNYISHAFSGDIFPLFTVISTIILFISLLIQLYLDISKTANFIKSFIFNLLAIAFNTVAIVFGFITASSYWRHAGILVFAILASVCALFVVVRLILTIVSKLKNNCFDGTKEGGKKTLALIVSAFLFCLVCGTMITGAFKEDFDTIDDCYFNDKGFTSLTIPDGVTSIGDGAFRFCSSLTSVVIPDSVTSIGDNAFQYCSSLTSVVIPDSVTSIGDHAFYDCDSLTSVVIGDSVTSIGDDAFYLCSNLTSVVIGDSVTSIGDDAFSGCYRLKDVYYTGSEEEWRAITISSSNFYHTILTIHYNYVPEN